MHRFYKIALALAIAWALPRDARGAEQVLTPRLHHLRAPGPAEWADFPKEAEGAKLALTFQASRNAGPATLRLRQQDVRQAWKVLLNGKALGRLATDENDLLTYLAVPPGALLDGTNELTVEQSGTKADDVRVGEIALDDRPTEQVLSEATVEVTVLDAGRQPPAPVPCRVTILDRNGSLATVGAASNDHLAIRPGVVYSGTGKARFGLPAGEYTLYAGRGFEYGLASARLSLKPGAAARHTLSIRREVPTEGYVSCDPHVHTRTYSGHGDATADEQVLAIAGEGVELPVATEHNRQVDYHDAAVKQGVRRYFTPVVGNEVTTPVGHFNVFPVQPGGPVPDFQRKDWKGVFKGIHETAGDAVVILNHARDLHAGFRPFGPERHLALTGEDLDGWELRADAMEVVNSGAQQTDVLRLVHDWLGLLNRGKYLTPVGSSDSHDVARHFVGQGRTYIRCHDARPDAIDVAKAVQNFREGRVLVSCGLLTEIKVDGRYGPGDLARVGDGVKVAVRVLGPSWVRADRVELYANGRKVREARITGDVKAGVQWEGGWTLPRFRHDVHLVAVATGPGVRELYWPIAKPYQPTAPVVERRVIGVTGAVWLDGDGDGKRSSAYDYARQLLEASWPDATGLVRELADYDEAVAAQAAGLLQARGVAPNAPAMRESARKAGPQVARGFEAFAEAWRQSQVARSERRAGPR